MNSPGFAGGQLPGRAAAERMAAASAVPPLGAIVGAPLLGALQLAALAPSGHNAQPWQVTLRGPLRWSVAIAADRRLPAVDPADREAVLGLGAFVENLCTAGPALGYQVEAWPRGTQVDDRELIELRLRPARSRGTTTPITARRTSRRPFARRRLSDADLARLCEGVGGIVWVPADTAIARDIHAIVVGATRAQARRDEAQAELASWIRWADRTLPHGQAGLVPADLEFGAVADWVVGHLFADRAVMSRPFRHAMVDRAAKLAAACGGWLLVTSACSSIESLIDAGRRAERLMLRARGLGIGIHPMSQALQEPGWRQDLERAVHPGGFPRMLLRVGYTDRWPDHPRPRLPPEAFTRACSSAGLPATGGGTRPG